MFIKLKLIFLSLFLFSCCEKVCAQQDTLKISPAGTIATGGSVEKARDSIKKYNPNKAVIRSAVIPGWGQVTNKKYWKVPLVYAALGITTAVLVHNVKQYQDAKNAYILATDTIKGNDIFIKQPYYSVKDQPERIKTFRNEVRQNVDYSVLVFLIFWGLNVADAAVDAHLKTFDVSDDLGLHIKAGYSPVARTNGLSLILSIR